MYLLCARIMLCGRVRDPSSAGRVARDRLADTTTSSCGRRLCRGSRVVRRTAGVYAADCRRATPPNPPPDLRHWASDGGTSPLVLRGPRYRSAGWLMRPTSGGCAGEDWLSGGQTLRLPFRRPLPRPNVAARTHHNNTHARIPNITIHSYIIIIINVVVVVVVLYRGIYAHTASKVSVIPVGGLRRVCINLRYLYTRFSVCVCVCVQ